MGKIIDVMNGYMKEGKPFFSFEFFPPKTPDGVDNLFERMDRMVSYGPTFCDITWGAGGSTAELTLDIADRMQNEVNVECMMHLTCTNMPEEKLATALTALKKFGVKNILALRGDPPQGQEKFQAVDGGFSCALDLIKYIRKETGDYFGIGVSGYPEAHPDAIVEDKEQMEKNYWSDIQYLKEKLDAGADFVVTQLFYDVDRFIAWVQDCRSIGITAPIIPGIMPIMAYGGFNRMTSFCKTIVPQEIRDRVEALKDDDAGLKAYGVQLGSQMCRKILDAKVSPGLHMYSLNQDKSVLAICEAVGLLDTAVTVRHLPFRARTRAPLEAVRPVHWNNRSKSYVKRTANWDTFPTSSWKEAEGQSYEACAGQSMKLHTHTEKRMAAAKAAWGEPADIEAVKAVFCKYVDGAVPFPWAEGAISAATATIAPQLKKIIAKGYLPINALPKVNAAESADVTQGWGPAGGYVYQKGYVEFFCSADAFKALAEAAQTRSTLSYMATDASGNFFSDCEATTAVAWGAFAASEIKQPLVACADGFKAWAGEAFDLWCMWQATLEEGSAASSVLQDFRDSWFLVSMLENDYVNGDVFSLLA
eukprot:jgi/Ulvmu1/1408/UM011_0137.1